MRWVSAVLCVALLVGVYASVTAQDSKKLEPVPEKRKVVKDRVKGSIHHGKGKKEWDRIAGRALVIDAHTLQFEDGTRITLAVVAPELEQKGLIDSSLYPCGKEAAEFLRKLLAPIGRKFVVARTPVPRGHSPLRRHPALQQHTLQGWIERAFFHLQHVVGNLLDGINDLISM